MQKIILGVKNIFKNDRTNHTDLINVTSSMTKIVQPNLRDCLYTARSGRIDIYTNTKDE